MVKENTWGRQVAWIYIRFEMELRKNDHSFLPKETSLDVGSMSKTPPNRRGITFEVGAQLEARDRLKNWYAANIEKIDYDDEKVLIHYRQWSHRYDEWFDWTSPYLRPVERIQLRRQGRSEDSPVPGFHVNDKVLASWSDCRFYPAKVLAVNKDASYTVKFYDGVIQTVKGIHVKPFVKEKGGRGKSRSSERTTVRRVHNGRDRRPQENGGPKNKRARRSISDQDEDSNSEDEEDEGWEDGAADKKNKRKDGEGEADKVAPPSPDIKREEDLSEDALQDIDQDGEKETGLSNGVGAGGDKREKEEDCHLNAVKKEEVETELNGTKPYPEVAEPYTELPNQTTQTEQVFVSTTTAEPSSDVEKKPSGQLDNSKPTGEVPPVQPVKPVRKQGFHNPNRFSREPLYRVIKNQPPPVLSINLDHNPFKCSAPGCTKSFRKAKLLHYHMKYYHGEEQPVEGSLSPTRGIQTRASEKQAPAPIQSPKRRRTISASMHPGGAAPSSRSDVKAAGRRTSAPPAVNTQCQQQRALLREKSKENQLDRNVCQQQDKDGEKKAFDIVKDRLKEKPKQKDFLRIKLKKKKKKKRPKSDYTGSEENIDISVLGLQSKLNLPIKFPLSHNHKPEAYPSRPGYSHSNQIHVNDEDSISDWSTDSCGWSDEDFGVDLDVTTPPLSVDSGALDTSNPEIVRCICEVEEENDFMIQCEECLCWQHGTCMGLLEENVPDRYACYICRDPPGQRQSLRYWYDREWLSSGHMYGLSFLEENYSHQNAKKIAATHQLLGDVHHVVEILNGLQLKMSVLQSKTNPDLRLWCQPWKQGDQPWKNSDSYSGTETAPSPSVPDEDMSRGEILMSNALEKLSRAAASSSSSSSSSASSSSSSSSPYLSFQDSYISSEHCYQKPRAYYPAVEQRLVVETRQGSELEDSMRSTEDLLEREQRYGELLEMDKPKALGGTNKISNSGRWSQVEVKEEGGLDGVELPDDGRQHQQWQINLLDHIDAVQDEVCHRMDFIERELDVLESWLDYTGELEPPEPLARLPQLKRRMKQLLTELGKVQQIALYSST
ncbi:PHD finger protein 20-like isoform X2 [Lampris incognitus]|uniref:PHD finger protein 20-like isoform X2 n=1 Tax=Lampris incognitus TaxID=2546036 RepID=UPI0024B607C8|nr:PHD finger protein 20-like isoform X2 [Lampris incognitus]